jgi:hypothetical protein
MAGAVRDAAPFLPENDSIATGGARGGIPVAAMMFTDSDAAGGSLTVQHRRS